MEVNKTKIMVCGRKEKTKIGVKRGGQKMEEVKGFGYLVSRITKDGRCTRKIKFRVYSAKLIFNQHKTLRTTKIQKQKTSEMYDGQTHKVSNGEVLKKVNSESGIIFIITTYSSY